MDVSDHSVTSGSADLPDERKLVAVELDDAGIERVRVDVVVKDKFTYHFGAVVVGCLADKKRATLPASAKGAAMQFGDASHPGDPGADDARLRSEEPEQPATEPVQKRAHRVVP